MSFQDLEAGSRFQAPNRFTGGRQQRSSSRVDPSQETAEARIFRTRTTVSSFYHLVKLIGTPKDTPVLREKLQKTKLQILELVKDTTAKLKKAREEEANVHGASSPIKKIAVDKLEKDFQSVLKDFEKAKRTAAEREITYTPVVPKEIPTSYTAQELDSESLRISQGQTLLLQSKRQEVVLLDNETFNEAIIKETDQKMREVQEQTVDVNEMFEVVGVLENGQRIKVDDISSHIVNSHAATTQATTELRKAAKDQRSTSSLTCLLILIFGIVLLLVIIIVLV